MSTDPSSLPPLPKNHLDHPENWVTGAEPVTSNQEGFIKVLEKQHPELVPQGGLEIGSMTKSGGSEVIEKLKSGEKVINPNESDTPEDAGKEGAKEGKQADTEVDAEAEQVSSIKRKAPETGMGTDQSIRPQDSSSSKVPPATESTDPTSPVSKKAKIDTESKGGSKDDVAEADANGKEHLGNNAEDAIMVDSGTVTPEEEGRQTKPSVGKANGQGAGAPVEQSQRGASNGHGEEKANGDGATNGSKHGEENGTKTNGSHGEKTNGATYNGQHHEDGVENGTIGHVTTNGAGVQADTTPGDAQHLDHPENWATGDQPATDKQKGFIKVLEKQKGATGVVGDVESLGKSEASEKIDDLKKM